MALFPPILANRLPPIQFPKPAAAGGWNVLTKIADQNVLNSAVPALDNTLFFNVTAGLCYAFQIEFYGSANGAQDIAFTLGGTATFTKLIASYLRFDNTNAFTGQTAATWTPNPWTAAPATINVNTSLNEFSGPIRITGMVIPATSGTFGLSWAQVVASAVNPTTVNRGSWLQYKQT
jgi:hypothetical protein